MTLFEAGNGRMAIQSCASCADRAHTTIDAARLDYKELNQRLRECRGECRIINCCGHRFIASGMSEQCVTVEGVPGNALGSYLNGASVTVHANAQDAVGDTMNGGRIVIHGSVGDAAGYAMRGGAIYVRDNAGYRAGIHMKAYEDRMPALVIGGTAGSFLGEYQAGGLIIVLGRGAGKRPVVGNFPCTGMHGGRLFLRGDCSGILFPGQVTVKTALKQDLDEIESYVREYGSLFGIDPEELLDAPFTVVAPDSKNPYKQMYVAN